MALNGWVKSKESILLRFAEGTENIKGGQVELLEQYYENDVRKARQITMQDISLLGTSEFSLSGVIGTLNAAALTGNSGLRDQVATLTADKAKLSADLAALQAAYDFIKPPETIPHKAISQALAKLDLANNFGKAVELADQVAWWWKTAYAINPLGPQWLAIAAEMDKAALWGNSSEAALLALAREIGGV